MKYIFQIILAFLILGNANLFGQDRTLKIIVVANCGLDSYNEDGAKTEGIRSSLKSKIYEDIGGLTSDNFLFFASNGDSPLLLINDAEEVNSSLKELFSQSLDESYFFNDKQVLWNSLLGLVSLKFTRIELSYYVSNGYIDKNLINGWGYYMMNFFPKELSVVFGIEETSIAVNLHYAIPNEEKASEVGSRASKSFNFQNAAIYSNDAKLTLVNSETQK
jgi:hypothetical protein